MASFVAGFKYLFGIHMGISRGPVDEIVEIKVGDKTAWRGSMSENGDVAIDAYDLFGGEDSEGGVQGTLTLLMGGPTQTAPSPLASVLTQPMPGFRGRVTAFFDGILTMMNPYPKPWKFRVRRTTQGWDGGCWYPGKATITIVRETSSGETGGSTETTVSTTTEALFISSASGEMRVAISPPGTLISVDSVSRRVVSESSDNYVAYDAGSGAWSTSSSNNAPATLAGMPSWTGSAYALTLAFPSTLVDVDSISFDVLQGENEWIRQTYDKKSGIWSRSNKTITILVGYNVYSDTEVTAKYRYKLAGSAPSLPPNAIRINPGFDFTDGEEVWVSYTYSITTTSPSTSTIGTAVIKAMNPAHIVYECLTNREWGRGLPRSAIDEDLFIRAADIFAAEGLGLCIRWTRRDEIREFIKIVLDHVTSNLFIDRRTGKIGIKLIRNDYVKADLPLFTMETGLLEITEADVSSSGVSVVNEVRVNWRDPVTDETRTVRAVNIAAKQAAGGISNTATYTLEGIPSEPLAQRVAKQRLNVVSRSLRRFNVTLDRRGYALVPGSVFRLQDGPRNIKDTVVRVATINYGSLSNGRVQCSVVQDEFGLPSRGLTAMPPKPWQPPNLNACVSEHEVFELPYRFLLRALTNAEFQALDESSSYIGTVVKEGNPMNAVYDIAVRAGAVESEDWPANSENYCGYTPPN